MGRKFILFCLLIFSLILTGESITITIEAPRYKIKKIGEYDRISLNDEDHILIVGNPELPVCREKILHPINAKNIEIGIISAEKETLPGLYTLPPVQKPAILSKIEFKVPERVDENQIVYSSGFALPKKIVELKGTGKLRDMHACDIIYYPFQWIPKEKKLIYNKSIVLEINYKLEGPPHYKKPSRIDAQIKNTFFLNKEDSKEYIKEDTMNIDYIIITDSSFLDEFMPLIRWKREKGLHSRIITTDSIYSNFPGIDNQEKIRNFINDLYENNNIIWVLLGGDTDIIPSRIAYAMDSEAGFESDEDSLQADLYYSDLDGNWNENGTPPYGEIADSIDLYPDVFVGRAPVKTKEEVTTFVNKVIKYEKNPPSDYLNKALFLGEILWNNPYTDAAVGKNKIDSLYVPPWINITKLYESLGNEDEEAVILAINEGQNIINHDGHAWYNVMGVGDGYLNNSDMDALENGDNLSILYSIGCWSNAFHYDAISEHFINNPNGGGVAFIGNSSYGWGSPGHPGFGYSDRFDANFYRNIFNNKYINIGFSLAMDKADFIPRSREENVYRWHQYQLNLLGDPEMPIWLDEPSEMIIISPDTVQDNVPFRIRVTDLLNVALESVRICITKMDGSSIGVIILERSYTDDLGDALLSIDHQYSCSLLVTATCNGYIPCQKTIILNTDGPYISVIQKDINEVSGNNDGIINPGEIIDVELLLKNTGIEIIDTLELLLKTKNSYIDITDSLYNFLNSLKPESTFKCTFSFRVDSSITRQSPANFELFGNSGLHLWKSIFSEMVGIPDLNIEIENIITTSGDSVPHAGDTIIYHYNLKNDGYGNGYGIEVVFKNNVIDPYISFADSIFYFDTILGGNEIEESLYIMISPFIGEPYLSWIRMNITTLDNFTFEDSFSIKIGETGFYDNLEFGVTKWEHYGINDLWHLSNYRSHSGDYSFYCGYESTHKYTNNMEAVLRTEAFTIFPPCTLSFYHWYEYPNYGNDGLLVIIEHGSKMDTLDFIGSGGSLDSILNIGNPWLEDKYDLSYVNAQDSIRIYFVFVSDSEDVADGIYIDDIQVTDRITTLSGTTEKEIDVLQVSSNLLYQSGLAFIKLNESKKISLKIYDKTGRLIRTLIDNELCYKGTHTVKIEGNIPSGIYFLYLSGDSLRKIEKIVVIR